MSLLELQGLGVERRGRPVLADVSLRIGAGEFVGLIGPNGAGKTTLLRAAMGLLPATGESSLARLGPGKRALAAAFLPQAREVAWPVSVETLVALGRAPHAAAWGLAPEDPRAVEAAIARLGIAALRHRPATELSGGELARALIARVLAQETPLVLADEPTAGLDPAAQIEVMALFRSLAGEGRGVLASIHDLGLAARHCTRLVVLSRGRLVADGRPEEVLVPGVLADVFGISALVERRPEGLVFQPLAVLPGA